MWKDVANIEQAEPMPLLEIEPAIIEFGNIGYVIPPIRASPQDDKDPHAGTEDFHVRHFG